MKGRLADLSIGMNGKQRLLLELDGDFRGQFDELKEHDVSVEIKRFRRKRSRDANNYAWLLVDKLAEKLNVTKEEIYREAVRNIGGVSEIVCVKKRAADKLMENWQKHGVGWQADTMPSKLEGCINVILYYGSSTYDSKQMSALIDQLVQECRQFNIETMPPEELAALEESWKGRK